MKVALLTTWEKKCGIADYSSALAKELKKLVELEIVPVKACPEWEQENIDQLAAKLNAYDLIHIQHAYSFFGGTLSRYNKFRELIGKLTKPFVITLHEVYYPLPFIHFQNLRPKIELNLFFKNILFGYTSYRERISLGALKKAARVIVHNRKQAEILLNLGLDEKAVSIVPHGVPSVAQDRPDTADVKAELGLAGKTVLTIFGFINWRKGYELAIEAVSKMPDDIVLLIAGGARVEDDQPNVNSLQALINSKGLQARVRITGYLQPVEVAKYFNATDIVLSPSLSAASSGALALALANGKPIVASDLPVNAEINEIVPCLELFRSGDSRKLSEKIILLLKDEAKRHELSAKADQYAKLWSFANVAKATVKIYSLARVNEVEEITSLIADLSFNEVRHLKSPFGNQPLHQNCR